MIIGVTGHCTDSIGQVAGSAGAGKDTVADRLLAKHSFVRIAMADAIKRACQGFFEFTDEQLWGPSAYRNAPDLRYPRPQSVTEEDEYLTPRYALKKLGTEFGRDCYSNVWIEIGLRTAARLEAGGCYYDQKSGLRTTSLVAGDAMAPKTDVVFSDIRFFNEALALREAGGKLIRVRRKMPGVYHNDGHASENELPTWPDDKFDYVIENDSDVHTLYLHVDRMLDVLKGKIMEYDAEQADIPPFLRKKK